MKLNKCFFCNCVTHTPIHLTEIYEDGSVEFCDMCEKCGSVYMDNSNKGDIVGNQEIIEVKHIATPDQLLDLIVNIIEPNNSGNTCECGMTDHEFDKHGRFGCMKCYSVFKNKMEECVFPFHKAKEHKGKRPKAHYIEILMQDPIEKMKILKLRYAKALELECYEKAAEIKKDIEILNEELRLKASSDQ